MHATIFWFQITTVFWLHETPFWASIMWPPWSPARGSCMQTQTLFLKLLSVRCLVLFYANWKAFSLSTWDLSSTIFIPLYHLLLCCMQLLFAFCYSLKSRLFFPNKDLEVDYEKQEKKEGVIIKTKYSSMFSSSPSSLPLMSKPTIQQIECTCKNLQS